MDFLSTLKSTLAAFIGVQSNESRKRDHHEGQLVHFIIVGVFVVVIFIAILWMIVSLVLKA